MSKIALNFSSILYFYSVFSLILALCNLFNNISRKVYFVNLFKRTVMWGDLKLLRIVYFSHTPTWWFSLFRIALRFFKLTSKLRNQAPSVLNLIVIEIPRFLFSFALFFFCCEIWLFIFALEKKSSTTDYCLFGAFHLFMFCFFRLIRTEM